METKHCKNCKEAEEGQPSMEWGEGVPGDTHSIIKDIDIDKEVLENIDIDKEILENIDIDKEILENIDIDIDKEILENIDIEINIDKGIIKISIKEWIKMSAKYDNFCLLLAYFHCYLK